MNADSSAVPSRLGRCTCSSLRSRVPRAPECPHALRRTPRPENLRRPVHRRLRVGAEPGYGKLRGEPVVVVGVETDTRLEQTTDDTHAAQERPLPGTARDRGPIAPSGLARRDDGRSTIVSGQVFSLIEATGSMPNRGCGTVESILRIPGRRAHARGDRPVSRWKPHIKRRFRGLAASVAHVAAHRDSFCGSLAGSRGPDTAQRALRPRRWRKPEKRYSLRRCASSRRESPIASIKSMTRCALAGSCLSPMRS